MLHLKVYSQGTVTQWTNNSHVVAVPFCGVFLRYIRLHTSSMTPVFAILNVTDNGMKYKGDAYVILYVCFY